MRPLPPFYFLLAVGVIIALHLLVPIYQWLDWPWTSAGIIIGLSGFSLTMFCVLSFTKHETTVRPFEESHALVTNGFYRYSRNPMYIGLVTMLTGIAVGMGTVTPLVVPPAFALFITYAFIMKEERMLAERFGEEYEVFRKRVRRWM